MNSQKFTDEELKKSKRIFKSATPKYDITWYVKWVSSVLIVLAMSMRGIEGLQLYDLCLSIVGVLGWLFVGIRWSDRALVGLNAIGLFFLLRNFIETVLL
tara:strand:- start:7952 stop:8251 length:300 start_codon:yes stop_codon:yes gene_type:complete